MTHRQFVWNLFIGVPLGLSSMKRIGYSIVIVDGYSMQPTLNPCGKHSDIVILNHHAIYTQGLQRGDIVTCVSPVAPDVNWIKRVTGLPGDTIYTNGYKADIIQIPEGHYWLEGDNINNSIDSNKFGPIPINLILSKAIYIVWPVWRWRSLYPTNHK